MYLRQVGVVNVFASVLATGGGCVPILSLMEKY